MEGHKGKVLQVRVCLMCRGWVYLGGILFAVVCLVEGGGDWGHAVSGVASITVIPDIRFRQVFGLIELPSLLWV